MPCSVLTRFSARPLEPTSSPRQQAVEADVVLVDRAFVDQPAGSTTMPTDPAFTLAIARLGGAVQ